MMCVRMCLEYQREKRAKKSGVILILKLFGIFYLFKVITFSIFEKNIHIFFTLDKTRDEFFTKLP